MKLHTPRWRTSYAIWNIWELIFWRMWCWLIWFCWCCTSCHLSLLCNTLTSYSRKLQPFFHINNNKLLITHKINEYCKSKQNPDPKFSFFRYPLKRGSIYITSRITNKHLDQKFHYLKTTKLHFLTLKYCKDTNFA